MTTDTNHSLYDPDTEFGARVADRLTHERVAWLTTVGKDGTPQPNPVWFLWDGDRELVLYTPPTAHRLDHLAERPSVAVHFNATDEGGNVVVLRGTATRDDDYVAANRSESYLDKYGSEMARILGSTDAFAAAYSVPVRIRLQKVRGL